MREMALETIREFRMIHPGEAVAVACSGGADSTALLLLLNELSNPLGCVLSVAHLNHCLRGSESDADEQFVRGLAERLGISFHVERADAGRLSRQSKINQEAAGRKLRWRFFQSLIETGKASCVALAHTADDQAETVLHRLLRGSSTRGLTGIHPVVENPAGTLKIIRPLIRVRRATLRNWLNDQGEVWREDASNQDLRLVRNRIRHELLPFLEQFNPRIVEALAHTAAIAREEEAFWQSYIKPLCDSWVEWKDGKAVLEVENLRQAPAAVAYRVLRWAVGRIMQTAAGEPAGQFPAIDFLHIERLLQWSLHGQSGQRLSLPQKVEARKEFSHLIVERREERTQSAPNTSRANYSYPVQVPCTVKVTETGLCFCFDFVTLEKGQARYTKEGISLLDVKLAQAPLSLRNWRRGDAYRPEGHRSPKKLHDLLQRKRIPVGERASWPVLVAAERIVWVRGLGVAEGYSPLPDSTQAVRIRELR